MSIVLLGSTSGSITLQEQAVAGTSVLTLPVGTGTVVANNVNSAIVSGTAVASTSGTSIDFTSIPSWVKRITVMFQGVSSNGTSPYIMRLGTSSGFVTTGYLCGGVYSGVATNGGNRTDGLLICGNAVDANTTIHGNAVLTNISGNSWVQNFVMGNSDAAFAVFGGGSITLGGTLDRVRITTVNGTDTFDAGSINILYE